MGGSTGSTLGRASQRFSRVKASCRAGLVRVGTQLRAPCLRTYAGWIGASVSVEP
jgi:hypothetical protein